MSYGRAFVERDRRGRERVVVERNHRSSSCQPSNRELINELEDRNAALETDIRVLQYQLSMAQAQAWESRNAAAQYRQLQNEHYRCRNVRAQLAATEREVQRLDEKLDYTEDSLKKLTDKIRHYKRRSDDGEAYRSRLQEALEEAGRLRRQLVEKERDLQHATRRNLEKTQVIDTLRGILRDYGLRPPY